MTRAVLLTDLLAASAAAWPSNVAIEEHGGGSVTYAELRHMALRVAGLLRSIGVRPGDRVGLCLPKSIDSVAAIFGIMEAGAAYVPVDHDSPPARAAFILHDCAVRVVITDSVAAPGLAGELERCGSTPHVHTLHETGAGRGWEDLPDCDVPAPDIDPSSLAYILYTSGSTGKPKGVTLTHGNAISFVDWCSDVLRPRGDDRFSSHAPFHFDLSILDLYVPLKHGATLVLIGSAAGREPLGLATLIAERRLTVWYSTPSILSMLAQYGKMQRHSYESLRLVLFAGEVFPIKHLRTLMTILPHPVYYNLYGPTETNVCTFYRLPDTIDPDRFAAYPIGRVCGHLRGRIEGADTSEAGEGELCIAGPAVMKSYWNRPQETERAFLTDDDGTRWYRTGDIVSPDENGDLLFVGRRDRMVKRRGYRIELGEVEAGLYRLPMVHEVAAVASAGSDGTIITAFLSCREGARPSVIELKRFCAENLAAWMIPDRFEVRELLPKTSTDKVDYQSLLAQL